MRTSPISLVLDFFLFKPFFLDFKAGIGHMLISLLKITFNN